MIDRRTVLAGAAATATATAALARPGLALARAKRFDPSFPQGFLWGAATAGHQVEGNNVTSDSWLMETVKPNVFAEPSGDAANSLELWPVDLDLVRGMGLNTYRFSLEWSRIEPEPGQFSIAMLDHYKAMIEGCRARGITPFVTFNHFTVPRWFAGRGGWEESDAPELFARFCDRAARHLAGGIGYATTLNEPNLAGILQALLPPAVLEGAKANFEAAAKAMGTARFSGGNALYTPNPQQTQTNLLAAHRLGRAAIKAVRADLPVGVSLAMVDDQAVGRNSMRDMMRERLYRRWLDAVKQDDFLGVQNYERALWNDKGKLPPPAGARTNVMGAEVYPPSLAGAVRYAFQSTGVPIVVTEHGVGTDDDTIRAELIPAALTELKRAMDEGVKVLGYCHWSLIDNFEWLFGYRFHYGLHSLDRTTFQRTAKPSAGVLAAIARANRLPDA